MKHVNCVRYIHKIFFLNLIISGFKAKSRRILQYIKDVHRDLQSFSFGQIILKKDFLSDKSNIATILDRLIINRS